MHDLTDDSALDLRKYLTVLRKRKWAIMLSVLVVVGSAVAFSYAQTPRYTAQARLLVKPITSAGSGAVQPVDIQTEGEVIRSQPVALRVQDELDVGLSIDQLLGGLSVRGAAGTQTLYSSNQVLLVDYTSTDPEFAAAASRSFAESYIDYRRKQALEGYEAAQNSVQDRLDSATAQLDRVTDQLDKAARAGDEALLSTLETQRSVLISRLGVLQQRLDDLQPDEAVQSGGADVIKQASVPGSPSSPNLTNNVLLAFGVGLALGIGVAFLRERLDDRFDDRGQIEEVLGVPVFASVPRFASSRGRKSGGLVTEEDSKGLASEAYRSLRTSVEFTAAQGRFRSLVITSPSEGEGKTTTTANLGAVLAQAGRRVVLLSADLRRPSLATHFGLQPGSKGLSDALVDTDPWSCIQDPGIPNLRVMPSGPIPENPAELLSSSRLTQLISNLEEVCDFVLIDSPPVLAVADASILASRVGGVLFVIDSSRTHKSAALHAKEEVERTGGRVIGTVLNGFDPATAPYYYRTYYYGKSEKSAPAAASSNGGSSNGRSGRRRSESSRFGRRR